MTTITRSILRIKKQCNYVAFLHFTSLHRSLSFNASSNCITHFVERFEKKKKKGETWMKL